jgi:hypothetical protein
MKEGRLFGSIVVAEMAGWSLLLVEVQSEVWGILMLVAALASGTEMSEDWKFLSCWCVRKPMERSCSELSREPTMGGKLVASSGQFAVHSCGSFAGRVLGSGKGSGGGAIALSLSLSVDFVVVVSWGSAV